MGRRMAWMLAACWATLAWAVTPAGASLVNDSPPALVINPNGGQVSNTQISEVDHSGATDGYYLVQDTAPSSTMATASASCTPVSGSMHCDPSGVTFVIAVLSAGADGFTLTAPLTLDLAGGGGNDSVSAGSANDTLVGGTGDDIIHGNAGDDLIEDFGGFGSGPAAGNDQFFGDGGDDTLDGGSTTNGAGDSGTGHDLLDGGSGVDTVDYSQRAKPLTISVGASGNATTGNDGETGEGDNVLNVERVLGGSADDTITADDTASTLDGRAGNDALTGGAGGDLLYGYDESGPGPIATDGNDALNGGAGSDQLFGQDGDDLLAGGTGADVLSGGEGNDTATYAGRSNPISVTLDDGANDGETGEGDNVLDDVENVIGGGGANTLTGDGAANTLIGGPGNDTLNGLGGDDTLTGADGDDTIAGGSGDDTIDGGAGNDTIDGASGIDAITCGPGDDTVIASALAVVAADCEHVTRPAVGDGGGAGPGGTGGGGGTTAKIKLGLPRSVSLVAKRALRATLTCPATAPGGCAHGTLTVTFTPRTRKHHKAPKAIRRAVRFTLGAGDSTTLTVALSAAQRRAIAGVTKVTLSVTARGAATANATVKLRRVKR